MATGGRSAVKMVVSYGGEISRCPDTGKARYAGGENRIVRVAMSERLGELRARLAALAGYPDVRIRYALASPVGDCLDNLHDVADDHDLWVLVTRLCCCDGLAARDGRVRAFLYPIDSPAPAPLVPDRIRRRASSPLLLDRSQEESSASMTATSSVDSTSSARPPLARAQIAIAVYAPAASPVMSSGGDASAAQVDLGFEALAEIAAAQRSATGYAASSSVASAGSAAPTGKADGGFDASLAAIAAADYTACGATATCAALADSGFEALAAVAAEQSGQGPTPPPAPVFLVPVLLTAVFFRAIPVYGCFIPATIL
ncbi:hypothetical protein GQ55_8G256800 [Panicum hallii var. hallii]|uniref:PB1 domain-containing protein n=1 Tax=Panicum hallii var. hallii TaxID=1504633 RepID=A0A2T7CR71_9POAL|nr:hypothetical protein GQ55_8G256800 [Panicum hallii var. hallii]